MTRQAPSTVCAARSIAIRRWSRRSAYLGMLRLDAGDVEGAIASLQMAVQLDPEHTDAWNNLGTALHSANRSSRGRAGIPPLARGHTRLSVGGVQSRASAARPGTRRSRRGDVARKHRTPDAGSGSAQRALCARRSAALERSARRSRGTVFARREKIARCEFQRLAQPWQRAGRTRRPGAGRQGVMHTRCGRTHAIFAPRWR